MSRLGQWLLPGLLLLSSSLTGCSLSTSKAPQVPTVKVLHLAVVLPESGADTALGLAYMKGAELAIRQQDKAAPGYRLALLRLDEMGLTAVRLKTALRRSRVLAIFGPLESKDSLTLIPAIERLRIPLVSPTALLPPAHSVNAVGRPVALFPLASSPQVAGRAAADVATSPAPGLGAHLIFMIDDRSKSGNAVADAFAADVRVRCGFLAGRRSIDSNPATLQAAVSAIVETEPDLVFYAGGIAAGAALRRTLSQTGAPKLPMLTAGQIAGEPGWAGAVGSAPLAERTIGVLPAPRLAAYTADRKFVTAFHRLFGRQKPSEWSAVAYDATMDEIRAVRELLRSHRKITPRALGAVMRGQKYDGVTGVLARSQDAPTDRFAVYLRGIHGQWYVQRVMS